MTEGCFKNSNNLDLAFDLCPFKINLISITSVFSTDSAYRSCLPFGSYRACKYSYPRKAVSHWLDMRHILGNFSVKVVICEILENYWNSSLNLYVSLFLSAGRMMIQFCSSSLGGEKHLRASTMSVCFLVFFPINLVVLFTHAQRILYFIMLHIYSFVSICTDGKIIF